MFVSGVGGGTIADSVHFFYARKDVTVNYARELTYYRSAVIIAVYTSRLLYSV